MKIKGALTVMVTPFTEDDKFNEKALRGNIDWYIGQGIHGLVCTGSTGSFDLLTDEERERVIKTTVDHTNGRVPVFAGTAGRSTSETVKWTKLAKDVGADGAMIVPPYYCLPKEEELYQHYKTVAEAVDIPIMIYNNPATSGVDMKPELLARCGNVDNILYVKESSGDVKRVHEIIQLNNKITVLCGWDDLAIESFAAGARGWVAAVANIIPKYASQLYELYVEKKDLSKAMELYYKILPICQYCEKVGFAHVTTAALNMIPGTVGGRLRRPRLPLTAEKEAELRKILIDIGVLEGPKGQRAKTKVSR